MLKRILCFLLAVLICASLVGCQQDTNTSNSLAVSPDELDLAQSYGIRAAVVYADGERWQETMWLLQQSPMLGLQVEGVSAVEGNFSRFDVLYLDESLLNSIPEGFAAAIEAYTHAGGAVFLPNEFADVFSGDYLGISTATPVTGCCVNPAYPDLSGDAAALQQTIQDFSDLYTRYADYKELSAKDYGLGFVTSSAQPLVNWDGLTVYALNNYGQGVVFLTNPLLPNAHSTGTLTMSREEGDSAYASTTASFNELLLCGFAEYIAKLRYGYALERVYGYYGTPSMAWELHYEEITGIANGSMQIFSQLCEEYNQIPSFTLIRNSYTWFQRAESVTYLCNEARDGFDFQMDYYESAYSSGIHVDADGQWLSFSAMEGGGSYFVDHPEHTLRAYPQAADLNSDGLTDIVCGSEDGLAYLCLGRGFRDGRMQVDAPQTLTTPDGTPIRHGGYSAPQFSDLDSDGNLDLLCGWDDGSVRWFSGIGSTVFEPRGILLHSDVPGQALPHLADLNGDGADELIVGSASGVLMVYPGSRGSDGTLSFNRLDAFSLSKVCANADLGRWLAPTTVDWNGDGRLDLAIGTFDGYIAILLAQDDGSYKFDSYISADEMNYKGTFALKFGNWAVPSFIDLNGDGQADLLCGSQEYGMAYPIDSGYFPFESQLRQQVAYAGEHNYYLGVHFYTNAYASPQREAYELQAHKDAFAYYGLDFERCGANQHTWYTSKLGDSQSMASIQRAGLKWQSGFASPNAAAATPQVAAENVVSLPFYLMEDGQRTLLIQNNSTLPYTDNGWYKLSARYGMPVCIYYHCDFAYESADAMRADLQAVQDFRETYGYNFNREDQMMLASAAALHQMVSVQGGLAAPEGLTLTLNAPSANFELYDEEVYSSLGVRVLLSERINSEALAVDADVWHRDGNSIVLGLNREVTLSEANKTEVGSHIRRINMAAEVTITDTGAQVDFLGGGMMELAVEGEATTDSPGWTILQRNGETIFTKYGDNERLHLFF